METLLVQSRRAISVAYFALKDQAERQKKEPKSVKDE